MQYEGNVRASSLDWVSLALVVIGAINWGIVGIGMFLNANWNVVNLVFGAFPTLEAAIYMFVGIAGLYELYFGYQLYRARMGEPATSGATAK
jgi:uncharacterized membrane protein YuzA (DUF378 family)